MGIFDQSSWDKAEQPPLVNRATLDRVVLHVTWVTSVDDLPKGANGAPLTGFTRGPELIGDDYHAYITCVQPVDFNDFDRIESFGHECWHAMGARHEPDVAT